MRLPVFMLWIILFAACSSSKPPEIVSKPIIFDDERTALSLEYMREHYGIETTSAVIDPCMVVVHWTAIPTFEGSFRAFYESRLPSSRTGIKEASALNVSVPYLIDRDGTIYQLMPDTLFARHVIGLNHCAIGIENVGDGDQHPLTEEQYQANKALIRYLAKKYDIDYVIGHHEYQQFRQHPLWLEKDPNYLTEKSDPGDAFMERLRKDLKPLNLKPMPEILEPGRQSQLEQGIRGQVLWLEGNLMPTIGDENNTPPIPEGEGIQRTVHIYDLTSRNEAKSSDGFFSDIAEERIKSVETDQNGYFSVALEPGRYSIFVEEAQGLFANSFDGAGNINPVKVSADSISQVELKVDYKAYY
jgi:hypothetical protein